MFALRRWWNRHALRAGLIAASVGAAWSIEQTNGVLIYELYHWVTRPLQPGMSQELQLQDSAVLELQQQILELRQQNAVLRELSDYEQSLPGDTIIATVIGRGADHWWQHLVINRGDRNGIQPGYVVTGPGGVVGRVVEVSPHTSRILLATDSTTRMGAKVSRSRVMGYIRGGQNDGRVIMELFENLPDVKAGDVVVTSSYSRLYPKDIPIGRIESLDLEKSPAPEAVIRLSAPIGALEWVVVHPFEPKQTLDIPEIPNLEPTEGIR